MKRKKLFKIIPAVFCLILSISLSVTAVFGWMSMNKRTISSGSQIDIVVSPDMVISMSNANDSSAGAIKNYTSANFSDNYREVDWNLSNTTDYLYPATHDWSVGTVTGLKYNTNSSAIDRETGLANTMLYDAVPQYDGVSSRRYYLDYVVFVASLNRELSDFSILEAEITEITSSTNTAYKSASIDFYVELVSPGTTTITPSEDNYKGTLNLATSASYKIDLAAAVPDGDSAITAIPLNTSGCIAVLMRCYFDGELANPEVPGTAYVNSEVLSTNTGDIILGVNIEAK